MLMSIMVIGATGCSVKGGYPIWNWHSLNTGAIEEWHEDEFEGLLSRAIQHETDHLNGIYIIDRVSEIEKIQYQTQLKELEKTSKKRHKIQSSKKGFVL